jgi:hypothetical protein
LDPSLKKMRENGGTPTLNHPPCTFFIKKKEPKSGEVRKVEEESLKAREGEDISGVEAEVKETS